MQQRILEAAQTLILEKGFDQTSLADVAQAAGVGRASIYYYFPNKDALIHHIVGHAMDQAWSAAIATVPSADTTAPVNRLKTWFATRIRLAHETADKYPRFREFMMDHRSVFDAVYGERIYKRELALVKGMLDDGASSGALRHCDSRLVASVIISLVRCLGHPHEELPSREDVARGLDEVMNVLLVGLLKTP